MDVLVQAIGGTGCRRAKSRALCQKIDEQVGTFLDRPIEGEWPYLCIDATYVNVRQDGRTVSVAVIVAVGVNTGRRSEVVGIDVGPSEEKVVLDCLSAQALDHGLSRVHQGVVAKVMNVTWQPCRIHFMRDVLAHAGHSGRRVVSDFIATAFA